MMATIDKLTVDTAYDADTTVTGDFTYTALPNTSATLQINLTVDGAAYNGIAQTLAGSNLAWNYFNGSLLELDIEAGKWIYTRPPAETGDQTPNDYSFVFIVDDGTPITKSVSATTGNSVSIDALTVHPAEDTDDKITGTFACTVLNDTDATIKVDVIVDTTTMLTGSVKPYAKNILSYTWTYTDGSSFALDMTAGIWHYIRKSVSVGDGNVSNYTFMTALSRGTETSMKSAGISTSLHFPPEIKSIGAAYARDSDAALTGNISIVDLNSSDTVQVDVTVNGAVYKGVPAAYTGIVRFPCADGSVFVLDTASGAWTYNRSTNMVGDNVEDKYDFFVTVRSAYGSDTANLKVTAVVEAATITAFSAAGVLDTSTKIAGLLQYDIPGNAITPEINMDVTVNGMVYTGTPIALSSTTFIWNYPDSSIFTLDKNTGAWSYARCADDVATPTPDIYIFTVMISCNNKVTTAGLTVKTSAGRRVYDYETAYKINFAPGSVETPHTAWPKVILEFERIYRLFNENMNYYEEMFQSLNQTVTDLSKELDEKLKEIMNTVNAICPIGMVHEWPVEKIPAANNYVEWHECDGSAVDQKKYPELYKIRTTLPDYRGIYLRGKGSAKVSTAYGTTIHQSGALDVVQPDAIRNITGSLRATDNDGSDSFATGAFTATNAGSGDEGGHRDELKIFTLDVSRVVQTANENRPVSKAVIYMIRMR